MRKTIAVVLLLAVVVGGLYAAMRIRAPRKPPPTTEEIWANQGIPVRTDLVRRGDMEQTIEVTGAIETLDRVTLSAKIAGRVARVSAREGDRVSAGSALVTLDQEDALSAVMEAEAALRAAQARLSQARTSAKVTKVQTDSAIEQAQSALKAAEAQLAVVKKPARTQERLVAENRVASAKANLDNAEAEFKRHQQLLKEGAISQSAFDVVETRHRVAKAEHDSALEQLSLIKEGGRAEDIRSAESSVAVAREQVRQAKANAAQNLLRQEDIKSAEAAVQQASAALAMARQRLSYTYVRTPISGIVAARQAETGQVIAPGQPLLEVVSLGSLYFRGEVSEIELRAVRKGQAVRVRVDAVPGRTFKGVVDEIYPTASTGSRSFPVRVRVSDSSGAVRPGMFARGDIVTGVDRDVLLVSKDAVVERGGARFVFSVKSDNTAARHNVEIVRENRDHVELGTPTELRAGARVITAGHQNVLDGSKLLIRNK